MPSYPRHNLCERTPLLVSSGDSVGRGAPSTVLLWLTLLFLILMCSLPSIYLCFVCVHSSASQTECFS